MQGKIDVYIRSIEKFGAAGALLTSGQAITLRFPTGDRHATQVTPHDQLVLLVREVAPPAAIEQLDQQRAVRFEHDSDGARYQISVQPRPNAWQVLIEPAPGATGAPTPPTDDAGFAIERGQYEAPIAAATSSGSALLDGLAAQARAAAATDLYLTAGAPAFMRVDGQLVAAPSQSAIDAELLARELGVIAPPEARETWLTRGTATFAYGDGTGRTRVTLTRDHRGPGATLRLLFGEAPTLAQLGLGEVEPMLAGGGIVLIGGRSGAGKTTTLAAMLRWLGEHRRRVVSIEDPIEIVHPSPWISQREVGAHVPDVEAGVTAAMQEGADAIVIGAASSAAAAGAVIAAAVGGHLVLTTVVSPADQAAHYLVDRLGGDRRTGAWSVINDLLVATITPTVASHGDRTFVVTHGPPRPPRA